jgi:hypothetical protein
VITDDSAPSIGSQIISSFPLILEDFHKKKLKLLLGGSCDGFRAKRFHDRCDWQANTLTVILDRKVNIFCGFTPAVLESRTPSSEVFKTKAIEVFVITN